MHLHSSNLFMFAWILMGYSWFKKVGEKKVIGPSCIHEHHGASWFFELLEGFISISANLLMWRWICFSFSKALLLSNMSCIYILFIVALFAKFWCCFITQLVFLLYTCELITKYIFIFRVWVWGIIYWNVQINTKDVDFKEVFSFEPKCQWCKYDRCPLVPTISSFF